MHQKYNEVLDIFDHMLKVLEVSVRNDLGVMQLSLDFTFQFSIDLYYTVYDHVEIVFLSLV